MTVDDLKKKLEELPGDFPLVFSVVECQPYFFLLAGNEMRAYTDIPISSVQFTKRPGSSEIQVYLFKEILREPTTLRGKDS